MRRGNELDRILALMIVVFAGDAEKLPPVVNLRRAIRVHGAMNHHGRHARVVGRGDFAEVNLVGRVGETFVVNDDVVALGPVGIVVEGNSARVPLPPSITTVQSTGASLVHGVGELLGLERVIVAATAGDQQGAQGFGFRGRTGGVAAISSRLADSKVERRNMSGRYPRGRWRSIPGQFSREAGRRLQGRWGIQARDLMVKSGQKRHCDLGIWFNNLGVMIKLSFPFTEEKIRALKVGDEVLISGSSLRDATRCTNICMKAGSCRRESASRMVSSITAVR
jgi:hypothetical protein